MAEKETWDLSREEIEERLRKFSQQQKEDDRKLSISFDFSCHIQTACLS